MSNKIDIALPTPAPNSTVYSDTFTYKGTAMLELALGNVSESNGKALVVTIDWGDGSAREVYKRRIVNLQSKYTKQTWPAVWVDTALKETSVLPNNVDCYRVGGGYIVGNNSEISCPPTTFDPLGFNN